VLVAERDVAEAKIEAFKADYERTRINDIV
jgi:hypothetical protein